MRCGVAGLRLFPTALAWRWRERAAQAAVRRQTAPVLHQMDAGQRYQRRQLSNSSRGESLIPIVPSDHGFQTCRRGPHWPPVSRLSDTAPLPVYRIKRSNLVTPMPEPRVGARKAVHTGTAGSRECRAFPFIPTSWANLSHVLSSLLPKGEALRDRGGHGAREFRLVVA